MQIHWAAKRGDHAAIERHLRRGAAIDARDRDGKTPLMYAAEGRQAGVETLRLLIDRGADVNAVSGQLEKTPLTLAARSGHPEKVRCLLEAGANPQFVNRSGYTAVTNVTEFLSDGHLEVLRLLLQRGADPDVITEYGECPLRIAVRRGNWCALRVLLELGASREPAEFTELMWAITLGTTEDVARELHRGADLSARDFWEKTPWLLSLLAGDVAKAQLLLDAGAERDDRGRCGKTSLMYPVSCNHVEMTRWLLELGVDPTAVDEFGETPLVVAARSGAAECVELLLKQGVPVNQDAPLGSLAIRAAANVRIAFLLKRAGADLDAIDNDGYHLLKMAAEADDAEFVRALLAQGADVDANSTGATALHTAAMWDHLEIVQILLGAGADPNAQDVDGWTPLMYSKSLECVELLLAAGADVHAADDVGAEAFQHHTDPEILDRLLQAGATVQPADSTCGTPLHNAAKNGDVELVRYLRQRGADVNSATIWGLTPLMAAAERGQVEVLRLLLEAGANLAARDNQGRTPLFYAAAPEGFTAFELKQEMSGRNWLEGMDVGDPELNESLRSMQEQMSAAGIQPAQPDFGYHPSDDVAALELLVQAGADLEARDTDGRTPLLLAAACGRASRVAALLRLGASRLERDADGKTAAELAANHHDPEQQAQIIQFLKGNDRPIAME